MWWIRLRTWIHSERCLPYIWEAGIEVRMKYTAIEWEKRWHDFHYIISLVHPLRIQQKLKDSSIHFKSLPSSPKYLQFYTQAKLFLKFSWQPASPVFRWFDVFASRVWPVQRNCEPGLPNKQRNKETLFGKFLSRKVIPISPPLCRCDA